MQVIRVAYIKTGHRFERVARVQKELGIINFYVKNKIKKISQKILKKFSRTQLQVEGLKKCPTERCLRTKVMKTMRDNKAKFFKKNWPYKQWFGTCNKFIIYFADEYLIFYFSF